MSNFSSSLFRELSDSELKELMKLHFSKNSVKGYVLCQGGLFNTTYRVDFEDAPSVILRLGPVHRELLMGYEHDMMRTEAEVLQRMRLAEIPCSDVLVVSTDKNHLDRDYMIVKYIDSVPLSSATLSAEERYRLDAECGKLLRKMHEIPCEAFGRATDVLFQKGYENFYESVLAEITDLLNRSAQDSFFTEEECERVLESVKRHKEVLASCQTPVLCHGDMWSGNILVKQSKTSCELAAIIDVDRAYFGDVDFDLGNPWILSDAFLEGYGITRKVFEVRERKVKRTVAALIYFLIEAYVWHAQYNNEENAQNGKRASFEKVTILEQL